MKKLILYGITILNITSCLYAKIHLDEKVKTKFFSNASQKVQNFHHKSKSSFTFEKEIQRIHNKGEFTIIIDAHEEQDSCSFDITVKRDNEIIKQLTINTPLGKKAKYKHTESLSDGNYYSLALKLKPSHTEELEF